MKYGMILLAWALAIVMNLPIHAKAQSTNTSQAAKSVVEPPVASQPRVAMNAPAVTAKTPTTPVSPLAKKVGFRLQHWKTVHSSSLADAKQTVAALEKLGCEVESNDHGDHVDVKFRCLEWKSIKLGTDQLVQQWSKWCVAKGLETVVINPAANIANPKVRFRLPQSKTVHLPNEAEARKIITTLVMIGCEVSTAAHEDHLDATIRCPDWLTLAVPSEAKAHTWQKWLDESGFETQHEHAK